jgi:release factor glutamine methyltransferase
VGPSLPEALQGVEVDCIVSNPPYIRESERVFMEERVLGWEPALALFVPDGDPLLFYRALALLGQTPLLRPGGALCVEINRDFGFETSVLFHLYGYKDIRVHPDLFGNERFVTCRKKNVGNQ